MLEWLFMEQWSPYIAGIGIGVLCWFAFLLSDKPIGCSTAFTRSSGMIERIFGGLKVNEKPYYKKFTPSIDWEVMLVVGIVIGAFISSMISGVFQLQWVPSTWATSFGDNFSLRLIVALMGGILLGFGSRWAGGCTSGHGISGTLQLALSSWIAFICFFAGGVAAAYFIFHILGG